jgi:hypothetical protein
MRYPVTPTLSWAAVHVRVMLVIPTPDAVRLDPVGQLGTWVSAPPSIHPLAATEPESLVPVMLQLTFPDRSWVL